MKLSLLTVCLLFVSKLSIAQNKFKSINMGQIKIYRDTVNVYGYINRIQHDEKFKNTVIFVSSGDKKRHLKLLIQDKYRDNFKYLFKDSLLWKFCLITGKIRMYHNEMIINITKGHQIKYVDVPPPPILR